MERETRIYTYMNQNPSRVSRRSMQGWPGRLAKRLLDIVAAAFTLLLLAPCLPWIARRIRRDSPGPVFYPSQRLGRNGKVFKMWKFRTMYERAESYQGPPITAKDDERITPYGKWLRKTKLNELPQFWNVLVGEMSLVGPRPEDPEVAASWPEEARREILSVRPGITSPATVRFSDEEELLKRERVLEMYFDEVLPSKQRLDQLYVRHHSLWGDLDILFWTALVLLPRIGKQKPPERLLFLGPISTLVRRYLDWFVVDLLIALAAIGITGLAWRLFGPLNAGWPAALSVALIFAVIFSGCGALLGINRVSWHGAAAEEAIWLGLAGVMAGVCALLINQYLPALEILPVGQKIILQDQPLIRPGVIGVAGILAIAGSLAVRYRERLVTGTATRWLAWRGIDIGRERALVVGGGETGQFAAWMLGRGRLAEAFRVVGFVDDDLFKQGNRIAGLNVLGQREDIPRLVEKHDVGMILYAIHNISAEERQRVLEICQGTPARVVVMPDVAGALNSLTPRSTVPAVKNTPQEKGRLPCELCLTKVTPLQVEAWLAALDETANTGDLEKIRAELAELRERVREDAHVQRKVNR